MLMKIPLKEDYKWFALVFSIASFLFFELRERMYRYELHTHLNSRQEITFVILLQILILFYFKFFNVILIQK